MACVHAHTYQTGDYLGWEAVREAARELIDKKDMRRFRILCDYEAKHGYRYVEENEMEDIYDEWQKDVVKGLTRYCGVSIGHKSEDEEEENWDDENHGGYDLVDRGREYYLAFHQWSAFAGWLESRTPEEQGMVREFEVRW